MSLFGIIVVPVGVCGFVHGRAASCGAKLEGWKGVSVREQGLFSFLKWERRIFLRERDGVVSKREIDISYGMVWYHISITYYVVHREVRKRTISFCRYDARERARERYVWSG